MQKIAFIIYRNWAFEIFKNVSKLNKKRSLVEIPILITTKECEFKNNLKKLKSIKVYVIDGKDNQKLEKILINHKINLCLFYGWSWIVRENILNNFLSVCLHPSPLPRYRGGTPIQHQLIKGEKTSAVTVFKMTNGIDSGDIYKQEMMSLAGNIEDIFKRIIDLGSIITKDLITDFINGELKLKPQENLDKFPSLKRRTPLMSEIKFEELENITFNQLNNLVRGLRDPFPNVFIKLKYFTINILSISKYSKSTNSVVMISKNVGRTKITRKPVLLKIKDGFAKLEEFKIL